MIRVICLATTFVLIASPSQAEDFCGAAATDANAAISASRLEMDRGESERAVDYSTQAVDLADTCFEAHMTLLRAYYLRFDHVEGLTALGVSRKFRKQLKTVRNMSPDHVEARLMEIRYLDLAPGIAGGNTSKARRLVGELTGIDPSAAYRARLDIERNESDPDKIIALLGERTISSSDELQSRTILVRELIVNAGRYRAAEHELSSWDQIALSEDTISERLLLRGVLRVSGGFEHDQAAAFLGEFIDRRASLPDDTQEPTWVACSSSGS